MPVRTEPLYPAYLPVRPEGSTVPIDLPLFDADERGRHADASLPALDNHNTKFETITPRIGTEVSGVQLSQLTSEGLDQVALLAAKRGVVVFVGALRQ